MQRNLSSKLLTAAPVFLWGLLIVSSPAQTADASSVTTCSNATLRGDFGFTIDGTLAVPQGTLLNGAGLPLRGVAMTHYDGQGNLTQVDHTVVNGMPPAVDWTPGTGTYTVNPDCTGTAVINSPSNPTGPLNLHFVVTKRGAEVRQVVDINAVTSIGVKLE